MASCALALFVVAAFLALIALASSEPGERKLTALIGLGVIIALWVFPTPWFMWAGLPFPAIAAIIALATVYFWARVATEQLRQAFA